MKPLRDRYDYAAEVDAPCEDFASVFESHLEDSYDFTTEPTDDGYELSINDDCSLTKNIFKGTPSQIKWSLSESENQKPVVKIRCELHSTIKKRLYKYAAILAFANFFFFPNAIGTLSDSEFVGKAWWITVSYVPTTIALVLAYCIGVLISKYIFTSVLIAQYDRLCFYGNNHTIPYQSRIW